MKSDQYRKSEENEDERKSLITNWRIFVHWKIILTKIYKEFIFINILIKTRESLRKMKIFPEVKG